MLSTGDRQGSGSTWTFWALPTEPTVSRKTTTREYIRGSNYGGVIQNYRWKRVLTDGRYRDKDIAILYLQRSGAISTHS